MTLATTLSPTAPTAVVTGGSRGIGRAIALALARDGYQVLLTYVSRPEQAAGVVEEITAQGGSAASVCLNVGDSEAVQAFFREQVKDHVNLACLVNNAGITRDKLLIGMTEEDFTRVLDVNLKGTYHTVRASIRTFLRAGYGRIINIASVVGMMGNAGQVNYAASKAGVIGLTKSIAREYAAKGITANAIAPGYIDTDMTAAMNDAAREALLSGIPVRRAGTPADVARVAVFLADEASSYITGEVIRVDGGLYI